jgi:hypothetical protein
MTVVRVLTDLVIERVLDLRRAKWFGNPQRGFSR